MTVPAVVVRAAGTAPTAVTDLRMSGLLVVALGVAMAGLHSLFESFIWWSAAFGIVVVVFAAAAVTRYFLRLRWTGTVAAAVAGLLVITLFFSGGTALAGFIPVPATFDHFASLMNQANNSIAQQSVPAFLVPGIQFFICWTIAGIAVVIDAMALWFRTPALTGVPLFVVLVVPSLVRAEFSDAFFFVLTAAVYLLIVRNRLRRIQPSIAVAVGAVAMVGALIVPLILPPVSPAAATGSGIGGLTESVNPIINLGRSLRSSSPVPALSYTTTSAFGQYLRLTTLENFQGKQWEPVIARQDSSNTVAKFAAPSGLESGIGTTSVVTSVQVANTTGSWLPTPYPTTKITGLQGAWYWQNGSLAVRSDAASMQGQKYTSHSLEVDPTVPQLRDAPTSHGSALARVPRGLDPIVASTARKVVGNAKTDFDKAIALQSWFTGGTFTYSTKTPAAYGFDGSGLDVIVPFLRNKSGYCVHFATTMAVMARTLGIPARVAVGFLPGKATHTGGADAGVTVYQVSSSDLHAWPELYFKGIGWVRFEPTPGRGFQPNFPLTPSATPSSDPGAPTNLPAGSTATPVATTAPHLPRDLPDGQQASGGSTQVAAVGSYNWLFLLLVLLLVPALIRGSQRQRRYDEIRRSIQPEVGAWEELRDSARDLALDARNSATPAELARYLNRFLLTTTGRKSASARAALDELRVMVEAESYGIPQFDDNGKKVAGLLRAVLSGLRAASPAVNRIRAVLLPATLVDRALGRAVLRA